MLIQPLTGAHDRVGFDCGRAELNEWLQRVARQHQDKGLSRTFVAVDEASPSLILGYYALTLTEVDASALPASRRKKLPRVVPGVRLGRLAIARDLQGRRLGELLLMDALERVGRVVVEAGAVALFVDAIDEHAATFYERYGFEPFPDDQLKLFRPIAEIR